LLGLDTLTSYGRYNASVSSVAEAKRPLEWEQARQIVIDVVRSLPKKRATETVPLHQAYGRTLAVAVDADRDYPALRRSLRDGFAVKSLDLPGVLNIRGEVRAGEEAQPSLAAGEALEIMTGAPVPDDADAVVMVEHVTRLTAADGKPQVKIDQRAEPDQFINDRGGEAKQGSVLIPAGTRVDASHVATLAMVGRPAVEVFTRPSVAILATGDEIVEVEARPAPHQIRNSNTHMLAALVAASGGMPVILPIARDVTDTLRTSLQKGLEHDMLLVSGGVSAGRYDLVKPVLRELGAQFHFERVRIQPGGPIAFATLNNKVVFGLPGNPGSSFVTYQLFGLAAFDLLAGQTDSILPLLCARFEAQFRHKPGLTRFLPARLSSDGEHLRHIPWQGSSDVPALARANAFLVADYDRETWEIGDSIRVMPKL
jgi:molybdopterin molybdotransferase